MATITVSAWKNEHVGFTGWDNRAREETRKRLRTALNLPPAELRALLKAIRSRSPVRFTSVSQDQVQRVLQILQTCGAEVEANPEDIVLERLSQGADS